MTPGFTFNEPTVASYTDWYNRRTSKPDAFGSRNWNKKLQETVANLTDFLPEIKSHVTSMSSCPGMNISISPK